MPACYTVSGPGRTTPGVVYTVLSPGCIVLKFVYDKFVFYNVLLYVEPPYDSERLVIVLKSTVCDTRPCSAACYTKPGSPVGCTVSGSATCYTVPGPLAATLCLAPTAASTSPTGWSAPVPWTGASLSPSS